MTSHAIRDISDPAPTGTQQLVATDLDHHGLGPGESAPVLRQARTAHDVPSTTALAFSSATRLSRRAADAPSTVWTAPDPSGSAALAGTRSRRALQKSRSRIMYMACHPAMSSMLDSGTDFLQGSEMLIAFQSRLMWQATSTWHCTRLLSLPGGYTGANSSRVPGRAR